MKHIVVILALTVCLSLKAYVPEPQPLKSAVEITAIYYPGTEHMPEWDIVAQTCPERKPLLGWYDEGNPEVIDWQIKWAVEHGISNLCVDWYWNNGRRRLEHWVKGYYKARYRKYLKWYMMYANHNQPGSHSTEDQIAVTRFWLDNYFKTPEYYMIEGRPVVCYWDYGNLDRDFIAEAKERGETLNPGDGVRRAFAISDKIVQEAGLPGIHWQLMWRGVTYEQSFAKEKRNLGFSSAISYGFVGEVRDMAPISAAKAKGISYDMVMEGIQNLWHVKAIQQELPWWLPIPTGWDDRPRSFSKSTIICGRTPEKFAEICRNARLFCEKYGLKHAVIHPINEWQEGSYIEPNEEYGFGMYDAIRDAFCEKPPTGWPQNVRPEDVGMGPYDFPPMYRSPVQKWSFDDSTEHWYRQPYGGGEIECHNGCLTFVVNILDNFNVRQRLVPFAANGYAGFRVRLKVEPNARVGLGHTKNPTLRLKWGTETRPIIGKGLVVDNRATVRTSVATDGEWHEYEFDLSEHPDWVGTVNELWFEAANIPHARVAVDWMRFLKLNELKKRKPIIIAADGRTEYVVFCPVDASNETRFTAFDFTNQMKRVTGADFPLVFGCPSTNVSKTIELGTPYAVAALNKWLSGRRDESHAWEFTDDGKILIAGVGVRGTAYGVYAFLEKEIGCRWLTTRGDDFYPDRPTLSLVPFSKVRTPIIEYRWLRGLRGLNAKKGDGALFAWRNGLNMLDTETFCNLVLPPGCTELRPRLLYDALTRCGVDCSSCVFELEPLVAMEVSCGDWMNAANKYPEKVVGVYSCLGGDCFNDFEHPNNTRMFKDLVCWCNRLNHTWMRYSVVSCRKLPLGGMHRWAKDLSLAAEAGVEGCFFECDEIEKEDPMLADVQTWAMSRHLIEPYSDITETIREFACRHNGAAVGDIVEYIEGLGVDDKCSKPSLDSKRHK